MVVNPSKMNSIFQKLYKKIYHHTNGFIPIFPFGVNVHPGDFFQIINGEFTVLGNIFNPPIVDQLAVQFETEISINKANWNIGEGVSKPYSGSGIHHGGLEGESTFNRQIIGFADRGSFLFKADAPQAMRIGNWSQIRDELIVKMTQVYYSFREVYVITDCVVTDGWTLAVAGAPEAELEIESEHDEGNWMDVFGRSSSKTVQSKNMEFYHQEKRRKSSFFKAKKLVVNDDKITPFISSFMRKSTEQQEWAHSFYPYDFYNDAGLFSHLNTNNLRISILDLLQGNQLNPNTALSYFSWANTNLDDISKLFLTYGE